MEIVSTLFFSPVGIGRKIKKKKLLSYINKSINKYDKYIFNYLVNKEKMFHIMSFHISSCKYQAPNVKHGI